MIAYDLRCSAAHQFEGWFGSSADYETQLCSGLLKCPVCGDEAITKMLSAPNIGRKSNQPSADVPVETEPTALSVEDAPAQPAETTMVTNNAPAPEAMAEMMGKLANAQQEMLKESKWVGRDFADEARAIHYGETDAQQIHGEASPDEAEALAEEGVTVAPLLFPYVPPEAKN